MDPDYPESCHHTLSSSVLTSITMLINCLMVDTVRLSNDSLLGVNTYLQFFTRLVMTWKA